MPQAKCDAATNVIVHLNRPDRQLLRELARQVAEAAALPVQAIRTRLWRDLNGLRPQRPLVLAMPSDAWSEIIPDSELKCADALFRSWERILRMTLYQQRHFHHDLPTTGFFNVPWQYDRSDYGVAEVRQRTDDHGSFRWDPPIQSAADLRKLHFATIQPRRQDTARLRDRAEELLGDILHVRVRNKLWWTCGMTDTLIFLRGLEQVMRDIYDNPNLLHELMRFLRDAKLDELLTYEREGMLSLNRGPDDSVGSGALGCTDELPAPGFAGHVRLQDMWVLGESQEFVGVGPAHFHEFVLQYQLPVLNRFGLVCYGCCEPLDQKFDLILSQIPKLRRVSVSPWCNRRLAAEKLTDRYVYSWKPNPALICGPTVDWDCVEKITRETLAITRGCCVEMVMKDTHTVHHDPSRISRWTQMAHRLAMEYAP